MMKYAAKRAFLVFFVQLLICCATQPHPSPEPQQPLPPGAGLPADKNAEGGAFVVTRDVYTQTFSEVQAFIASLNEIIRARDYDSWVKALSPEYIAATDNEEFLRAASQEAALKSNNVVLKSLRDYFLFVVVPSRSQAALSEISFIDASHVKAITVIDGTPVILYKLVKKNAVWMVGVW